ncbi:uncharacterized protein LOC123547359 [Mercenaria mercenaria]|uniref:uncharacterized protein LOC123547359 n=1 Tax=Mercenaria mercenaria TaxID=6596 RepID=UPI00234EDA61|nr:uncharacterized protein LOC123547359 [Mercenaria mercenaria]
MSEGTQLQPETILHVSTETESRVWSQGGITDDREDSLEQEPADIGMCILQHGTSTRNIHNYFMSLEQRKCCLLLAACKQRFFSVRLVRNDGRDSGIEEGAMMKSSVGNVDTVVCLDAEEFQVFQQTLKCAAFPVLGAPDPPSEATPIPSGTQISPYPKRKVSAGMLQYDRTMTPLSLHDSGVEEQEDTAMVPAETLCELLRRAFRLTQEKFNQYEEIIAAQLERKSPQKVLAEELVRQLIALENNENPYYNPKTYLNRIGYDQWQKGREQIYRPAQQVLAFFSATIMKSMHKQYQKLLERLISYESPYRQQNELIAPPPTSPLSSASVRLLKEFSLRYGVRKGEETLQFCVRHQTMKLEVENPKKTDNSSEELRIYAADRTYTQPFSILENSLHLLEAKSSAAISKMKTLYTNKRPLDGVEPLIELLSLTLRAKTYLLMSPEEQLGNKLYKIVQAIFPTAYERHKMVAEDELRHNKWDTELSPQLTKFELSSAVK